MNLAALRIYLRNHLSSHYVYYFIALSFTFLKLTTTDFSKDPEKVFTWLLISCVAGAVWFVWSLNSKRIAEEILEDGARSNGRSLNATIATLIIFKIFSMTIWFIFLFFPYSTNNLLHLLPGYFFIFGAISIFNANSTAHYPLLVIDILIQMAAAALITAINFKYIEEVRWIGMTVMLYGVYSLYSGRALNRAMLALIANNNKMRKIAEMADKANRAKTDFLAMVSHEIRTPMAGIIGMVDFMKETPLTTAQKECVETISQCSKTLLNTLNDVIEVTREELGAPSIHNENISLHQVIRDSTKTMQALAEKKGLYLRVDFYNDVPDAIYGDANRLQQVLFNLLNNAIKFTAQGGVTVIVKHEGKFIRVDVCDTGIGISSVNIRKLFKKFSQENASIIKKYGGSGLGLSIAKQLVELMGGEIGVRSAKGAGSDFWFRLPYRPPVQNAETFYNLQKIPDYSASSPGGIRVLVVEDNKINQMIATRTLQKRTSAITVAQDGFEALTLVKAQAFDLILMDSNMPGKSGAETVREIKALGPPYSEIPVIALTANAIEEHIQDCYKAGVIDHLIKPYTPLQLLEKVDAQCGTSAVIAAPPAPEIPPARPPELQALAENFGEDYMHDMIRKSLLEIERLMKDIRAHIHDATPDKATNAAHDIKSVSGYIGMQATSRTSEQLEKSLQSADGNAEGLFATLQDHIHAESAALETPAKHAIST